MYQHLLVPIDGSPLATLTVDQAVAYARATAARLTFLHVRADRAARGDGALLHAMSPETFADAAAGNARALVGKAEAAARAAGVPASSVVATSDRPHEAIVDAAREHRCDLIFMASHGRRGIGRALLGSVTRKVLERAALPVLVAAVESNLSALGDEQKAVAVIRDEHRSLAAVLHALLQLVDDAAPDGPSAPSAPSARLPDRALLRAMVFYIEQFPERLHHPKEEAHLFCRLRQRTHECDALLEGLEAQHRAGNERFAQMRAALDADDTVAFAGHLRAFARLQWAHMADEEQLVLPAASRHLGADDWREIADAFAANADPRLGTAESFQALASRLLEMAAASDAQRAST